MQLLAELTLWKSSVCFLNPENLKFSLHNDTRSALGRAHLPPTTVFRRLETTCRCFDGRPIPVRGIFPNVIKFRVSVHTLWEKAIRFRHPDYDPDQAQKLISSSMSRHLSTRKMSSKSMHAFGVILLDRQTDKHRGQSHLPPPLSEVKIEKKLT